MTFVHYMLHSSVLLLLCAVLDVSIALKSPQTTIVKSSASDSLEPKVVEHVVEHVQEKAIPLEQGHHHLPKDVPIVIEETHDIHPESHVEFSPESHIQVYPIKGHGSGGHHRIKQYPLQTSRPNTHFLVQVVPPGVRRKHESGIPDLLAVLAPLAAIPLLGSLAVSSFTTMLTLTGLGRRRRRRDLTLHRDVLHQLTANDRHNVSLLHLDLINGTELYSSNSTNSFNPFDTPLNSTSSSSTEQHSFPKDLPIFGDLNSSSPKSSNPISELFQLDVVQQYLRQSGRPDHNDQIIASYLACRGLFSGGNHCLERLACHYADMENGRLRPLERDVAALIIYSLLRNSHIDSTFKRRLQRAALFGYDHASNDKSTSSASPYEPSFVPVCDREFPCPKSEMP